MMYEVTNMDAFHDLIRGKITKKNSLNYKTMYKKTEIYKQPNNNTKNFRRRNNRIESSKTIGK